MKIQLPPSIMDKPVQEMAKDNCIVRHLAGSHAYGTSTPTSDVDYRGIFVADPQYILTPFYNVGTVEISGEEDTVYHEVGKYLELLIDQNPNIIETLWVDESCVEYSTPAYDYLRSNRETFLSNKCMYTYSGYANSQLKRLKGHHRWLETMEDGKKQLHKLFTDGDLSTEQLRNHFEGDILDSLGVPYVTPVKFDEVDYDWTEVLDVLKAHHFDQARLMCNIPYMEYEFANVVIPSHETINKFRTGYTLLAAKGSHNVYHVYSQEGARLYDGRGTFIVHKTLDAKLECEGIVEVNTGTKATYQEKWTNYHKWRNNRNEARSALEAKHGYDTKHASHLIRLLKTGCEILEHGQVFVKRPDAQELTDIRNGSLTLGELLAYADSLESKCAYWYENTKLPRQVDRAVVANILINLRSGSY